MQPNRRIKIDYKPEPGILRSASQRRYWIALTVAAVMLAALTTILSGESADAYRSADTVDTQTMDVQAVQVPLPLPMPDQVALTEATSFEPAATNWATPPPSLPQMDEPDEAPEPQVPWTTVTVKRGDSLAKLFDDRGLPATDWLAISQLPEHGKTLTRLKPGDEIRLRRDRRGTLKALKYPLSSEKTLVVTRAGDGFTAKTISHPLERRVRHAQATIDSSLFLAGQEAGLSERVIMELAQIFAWDIDFALDIRKGDSFTILYEELYRDGEHVGNGPILAAQFNNQGRTIKAVRYEVAGGKAEYYTPDGRNMRKAFLRTPVDFTRISSRFNPGRRHPVLNKIRAHRGVDYAAPTGTSVKAAGDGKIVFRGRKGGYGNVIIIEHAGRYSTLYAHLSGFSRKVRLGSRVEQGQIVGFVGMTGLATGPHLHYEFRVNGIHKDPLKVKLPTAEPLPKQYHQDFDRHAAPLLAQLDTLSRTLLARNDR